MRLFRRSFARPGAPPGTVVAPASAIGPEIHVVSYDAHSLDEGKAATLAELPDLSVPGRVDWVDVRGLGDGTLVRELGERHDIHPLAVSDVLHVGQRPKVERYENGVFIVLRMVTLDAARELHWEQVSVFLGDHFVISFQETPLDCLEALRERIRAGRKRIRSSGADYLACMIADAIVDGYFPILEHYGDRLEDFEAEILERPSSSTLSSLYLVKRELTAFRRAAWPLREALSGLLRDEEAPISRSARLYLRDTADHTMQVVDVNESYRELAASLIDVYLSMLGHRTNEIMRVLTIMATIFIPLTFVAGIYGMNFDTALPGNLPELGWPYGYALFWGVCLVLIVALLLLFRRLGWLGGRR